MDYFVTCAFIITIILYAHLNNISSKHCGVLNKSISTSFKSTAFTAALVEDCKFAFEVISCDAVKLKMLNNQSVKHLQATWGGLFCDLCIYL